MTASIGFDAKRAVANNTGLGNYSRLVIEAVASLRPDLSLTLYTPRITDNPRLDRIKAMANVMFATPTSRPGGSLWRSWGISRQLRHDLPLLYHGLSNELPLNIRSTGIPSVVTMHDVIYRRLPYCYSPVDRILYDLKYGRSCREATRIIAVSQRTKEDVADIYSIDPDKIDVVYQGCDDSFKTLLPTDALDATRRHYNLPKRFILQVGTIERRKNLELTVRALSKLPKDVGLVAVGRDRDYLPKVRRIAEELGVASRLHILHDVPFSDLPSLNQLASAICYPSHYEGFGIPVLEGLESMRPVVAATGSCLEEAGGEAAFYVDPNDPRQLADVLSGILAEGVSPGRLEEGKRYAARFDNRSVGRNTLSVYEKIAPTISITLPPPSTKS